MNFTDRLNKAIEEKGISQAELCRLTNMNSGKSSQLVNGKVTDPRMSTLVALSDALDVSIDWLAGREGFDMRGRIAPKAGGLDAREGKLVGDYRATSDRYKPDVSHYAEDMAARHPKNKGAGAPLRREGAA